MVRCRAVIPLSSSPTKRMESGLSISQLSPAVFPEAMASMAAAAVLEKTSTVSCALRGEFGGE